jgi:catalase
MNEAERTRLIDNILGPLKTVPREIQERQVKIFMKCDPEYGERIAEGLGFPANKSRL